MADPEELLGCVSGPTVGLFSGMLLLDAAGFTCSQFDTLFFVFFFVNFNLISIVFFFVS